jgi:hypothetical protein
MFYTPTNSTTQVNSDKRLNKKSDLAIYPTIDPYLVSIAALTSRLIDQVESAFNSLINAPINDRCEVSITSWYGGIPGNPLWSKKERVEVDGAFNMLVMDTYDSLQGLDAPS